jgi:uncharacterized protein (TIGR00730 family)
MLSICIFGGARNGSSPIFRETATALGKAIAKRGHRLVYGAGRVGMMGFVAQAALDNGARVTGVIPQFLAHAEVLHGDLSETIVVDDLFERKGRMIALSDAYIALPGGLGTLDELLEVLTWRQLRQLDAPIGVLDVANYFEPWFAALRHFANEGFVDGSDIDRIIRDSDPLRLLDAITHEHRRQ